MEKISKKEQLVLEWLKEYDDKYIILDIGANKGFYSEKLFDKLNNKIKKIYAFEPVIENYNECLKKFNNNDKIEFFNKACSNEKKYVNFYQIISKNNEIEGLSSLYYRNVFNGLESKKINVECIVIDDFLTIDKKYKLFIKIDTEGHELNVMMGMFNLFKDDKIFCLQFEYGDCMIEQQKNLNNIVDFINNFNNYKLCDFDIKTKVFFEIDKHNINNYINKSWENLFILKKNYKY